MRASLIVAALLSVHILLSGEALAQGPEVKPNGVSDDARLAPWRGVIEEAAQRFGVPRDWISGVVLAESGGRTHLNGQPITSPAGAMGLMQLMPATYADMRSLYNLGSDPHDPHDNIFAGTAYLRAMFDRYGYPGLFAAYNAGPKRYEASLRGAKLPGETRNYVAQLTRTGRANLIIPALFVRLSDAKTDAVNDQGARLFVPLTTPTSPVN